MESSGFNLRRKKRRTEVRRKQRMNQFYGSLWATALTLVTMESMMAEPSYVETVDTKSVVFDKEA